MLRVFGARNQRELGDGCDRCERFAAKAHRMDGLEFFERTDFARGVTRQCESEFVFVDPTPIINHRNPSDATRFESDLNALSASIDGIFH